MYRDLICKDCSSWKMCPNVELGICEFDAVKSTTWYNSRCILGLEVKVETPEIECVIKE